ncbi:MAG: class I SAM-dependent methyltransferase [Rhodospirillaceae bacterium]|nr:class I SAM-dependent methyltransferase [Rhodospirillaceae bacterium]
MSKHKQVVSHQFQFKPSDVRKHCLDKRMWHEFVRLSEIELILSILGDRQFENALEIGSGDGLQSERLSQRCDRMICSDIDRKRWDSRPERNIPSNISHISLDATDLSSFSDNSFDLVYSSNVLEHVEEIDLCLSEIYRVLRPSGIGIHSMPSRHWKVFNSLYRISRFRKPKVHGIERTNWKEFVEFGLEPWLQKLNRANFRIEDILGMPFYLGASGRWSSVIIAGNGLRLPSSFTFFVRPIKAPE